MVYTVTLNPAIDYMIFPDSIEPGKIHRYGKMTYGPGGKGVNVSLLLSALQVRTKALGFCAGFSGREIADRLEAAGCETDFIWLPQGCSRINFKICTPDGAETDFNQEGREIPPACMEQLFRQVSQLRRGDTLVLAGSIPEGVSPEIYSRLMGAVEDGVETVVDATGNALLSTLPHHPFLIKPNEEELGQLFGIELHAVSEIKAYALELVNRGAQNVVVSMGERGAMLANSSGATVLRSVKGEVLSTVGAGDSLVAGFLYGLSLHNTLEGGLRWGVAAGAATAFSHGIASPELVKALYPQVGNPYPV